LSFFIYELQFWYLDPILWKCINRQFFINIKMNLLSNLENENENEILAHRFHMDIFQKGDLKVADEILSPNFILYNPILPPEIKRGPEGVKKFASATMAALPDKQFVHEDTIAKGDKVMIRWTLSGTNTGSIFGNPPTGKHTIISGFDLFRISDGKIIELWQQYNFGSWT
jgi:predicted SnoaL-like aldol condensation-catalyzing enzyme